MARSRRLLRRIGRFHDEERPLYGLDPRGDILTSFLSAALFAGALMGRMILALGAAVMALSGVVFASFGKYWALLLAAIVGVSALLSLRVLFLCGSLPLVFIGHYHSPAYTSSSWVTYFFQGKFNLREGSLGTLFFTTSIIAAVSMLLASSIAKRAGNIKV